MKLKSIEQEAKDCRKAFKGIEAGVMAVHCHHENLAEKLTENPENRIAYILAEKPKEEQALRLRLFRPVAGPALAEYKKVEGPALAEYEKVKGPALAEYKKVTGPAHALICKIKGCPWDGKSIFPKN